MLKERRKCRKKEGRSKIIRREYETKSEGKKERKKKQ